MLSITSTFVKYFNTCLLRDLCFNYINDSYYYYLLKKGLEHSYTLISSYFFKLSLNVNFKYKLEKFKEVINCWHNIYELEDMKRMKD